MQLAGGLHANGNMVYHHDEGNSITQRLCWDEINRLIATSDGSQISHYIYDANGERAMKYNGTLSKIQQNKYTLVDCASMGQFTYYINPLMTVSTQEYTKHYFIEGQRVMSKIGAGMANNLMDMEDGAYDYIMSALSDSIKNQLAASFECLSLDGIAVFNTSIEPILEMANQNNHEFLRYFYHPDHLGSSSFITGATGEPTQHLEYLPFGELFIEERSTWNTPYKFSGKELDDETGYSYFGARYYDPNISIWLSVDPLASEFPGISPYAYCFNNPVVLTDPDGLAPGDPPGGGYYTASINSRYIGFGLRNPVAASRIGFGVTPGATNISTNSTRFATRGEVLYGSKRSQEDRGSENGAFRHTLWQATITSEFDRSVAAQAGNAHEENAFVDLSIRTYTNLDDADQTVDLLNNIIGRNIGDANKGANMNKLANLILDEFYNNGLYTATQDKNGNWVISKTKLSTEKYNQLKEIYKGLNANGRTASEQNAVDAEAKENLEQLQLIWGTMK